MSNFTSKNQKGVSTLNGIIVIISVAVLLFGGVFVYQYYVIPKADNQLQTQSQQKKQSDILTENDILKATYTISANFGGKKTMPQNLVLPYGDSPDRVYIAENGSVLINPPEPSGEAFWIYKYEFIDSTHTQAKVYIGGNFGASGHDNRIFNVRKSNGTVITEEIINN